MGIWMHMDVGCTSKEVQHTNAPACAAHAGSACGCCLRPDALPPQEHSDHQPSTSHAIRLHDQCVLPCAAHCPLRFACWNPLNINRSDDTKISCLAFKSMPNAIP
uniref:Uncharacterized protein n=1 Tax=Eutreptiella gymnastica TaxID=73025 RepID=A0A6T2IGL4_9EUGL